ncbi:phosphodiester glycosidase family protein [Candidatus Margulisiibacteriota bacterium]
MTTLQRKTDYWSRFFVAAFCFVILAYSCAEAATLKKIRYKPDREKLRVVFDLDGESYYQVNKKKYGIEVRLLDCEAGDEDDHKKYKVKDWILKSIDVKKSGRDIVALFPMEYPVKYKVYPLGAPSRLVVDFGRDFRQQQKVGDITEGLTYYSVTEGSKNGFVSSHVLKVDPEKVEVFPALAARSPTFFQSLMNIFTPWQKLSRIHFHRDKVSTIQDKNNALAGINGTYFSYTGRPLGVLVINGDLITYPIYNRSALIINDNLKPVIDRVTIDSYVEIAGMRYEITGVNEPRDNNDVIIFTKHYGEYTGTNRFGYELTIRDNKVVRGYVGNSSIPDNGFVISFSPMFIEHLVSKVKPGDKAMTNLKLIPFSNSFNGEILHVLGGGPRLLKRSKIYISRHFEKFKRDVTAGRAARTAVGITRGKRLLLVAVDGKSRGYSPFKKTSEEQSIGMTLEELAELMLYLGAEDALNLDGGSSTAMAIHGRPVSRPVGGGEKPVSNALLLRSIE